MFAIARVRYLLAMGLASSAGVAVSACRERVSSEPSRDAQALAVASVDSVALAVAPRPAPFDAGVATTPIAQPEPLDSALRNRATCPIDHRCEPAPRKLKSPASPPYGNCEASTDAVTSLAPTAPLDVVLTAKTRESDPEACCYSWMEQCPGGRSLREPLGALIVAETIPRDDWHATLPAAPPLAAETRERLAAHWRAEAAAEHASVASFARFSLQLLALGAPAALVDAAHAAARDEVRHARACYALASRYGSEPVGPAPLPLPSEPLALDPTSVARETLRDGCLGESVAARTAQAAAERSSDPVVARVLRAIAADEDRHAELAWKTMAWLLREHPASVHCALEELTRELISKAARTPTSMHIAQDSQHGVLGAVLQSELYTAVVAQVVLPCAAALAAA